MVAATWHDDSDTAEIWGGEGADWAPESARQPRPLPFTKHARTRGARRNVTPDSVEYVLAHGRTIQRTGVTFFFLGRRDMPPADRGQSWASRLEGTIVLVAPGGEVITVYRNRRGWRAIQRKTKYRLPDLASFGQDLEAWELKYQAAA